MIVPALELTMTATIPDGDDRRGATRVRIAILGAMLGAATLIGLSACNTVRGVAKDVTGVADAFDPSQNN